MRSSLTARPVGLWYGLERATAVSTARTEVNGVLHNSDHARLADPSSTTMTRLLLGICLTSFLACGGSTEPTAAAAGRVDVRDNSFSPAAVDADQQKSVTWTWRGAAGHNVTFEDGAAAAPTQVSGSHVRVFDSAGTYRYRCTVHSTSFTSGMVGSVKVN